jgi:hypothetical protein
LIRSSIVCIPLFDSSHDYYSCYYGSDDDEIRLTLPLLPALSTYTPHPHILTTTLYIITTIIIYLMLGIVLYVRGNGKIAVCAFQCPFSLPPNEWGSLAISINKVKRFGGSKTSISVFLNGMACPISTASSNAAHPSTSSPGNVKSAMGSSPGADHQAHVDIDIPIASNSNAEVPVDILIGKSVIAVQDNSMMKFTSLWKLGPLIMYDAALSHHQGKRPSSSSLSLCLSVSLSLCLSFSH